MLISPAELEDLEDALALARLERDRTLGHAATPVPHDEARRVLWEPAALNAAAGHLKKNPHGVDALLQATDQLADSPRPEGSHPWGTDHRRLRLGPWRVLHRVDPDTSTVHIEHVGHADA